MISRFVLISRKPVWNIIESIKEFTLVKRNVTLHCNVREIWYVVNGNPWVLPFANLINWSHLFHFVLSHFTQRCIAVYKRSNLGDIGGGLEPTLMAGIYCSNLSLIRNQESRNLGQICNLEAGFNFIRSFDSILHQIETMWTFSWSMVHLFHLNFFAFSNPHWLHKGHFLEYNFVQ